MSEKANQAAQDTLRRKAYAEATSALRTAHRAEWDALYEEACAKHGVPYSRRLTPREKAEAQIAALRAQFPDLA